ncbi:uncharacterized protein LOC143025849 [Oratosquilla oratoria]|uniref:uncharacterized protein LOC143025849 n=1 Tax=Oratosquilla oratoria TaxID=337810 RepID=UPI003F76E0AB
MARVMELATTTVGKKVRESFPTEASEELSTLKKAARARPSISYAPSLQEDDSSSDTSLLMFVSHNDAPSSPEDTQSNADDAALLEQLLRSDEGQPGDDEGEGWTTVVRNRRARHQLPPRPKFKLGHLGDHDSAYQAITALERENPSLKMEVRLNLQGEHILKARDEASAVLLRRLAEEGNTVILLDPNLRRHKVVLERYPLDLPLKAVEAHPKVISAERLRSRTDKLPTRQVLVMLEGQPPPKLDLGCWGRYSLRPHRGEPVRCYKCQRYNHLQARCEHAVRCGVCSLPHPTEDCIAKHKSNQTTSAKCPNCGNKHHAWNPRCPERVRRLPRLPQKPQQQQRQPQGPPQRQQQRQRQQRQPQGPPQRQQRRRSRTSRSQSQQQKNFVAGASRHQDTKHQHPPRSQPKPQQQRRQAFQPASPPTRSAWGRRRALAVPTPTPPAQAASEPEEGISRPAPRDHTPYRQPRTQSQEQRPRAAALETGGSAPSARRSATRPRQPGGGARDPPPSTPATSARRPSMGPTDPSHDLPRTMSEEIRTVVSCIMTRMMQFLVKLLTNPNHDSEKQGTLSELLQETVSVFTECGFQPPPDLKDTHLRSLYPADPNHQNGESTS